MSGRTSVMSIGLLTLAATAPQQARADDPAALSARAEELGDIRHRRRRLVEHEVSGVAVEPHLCARHQARPFALLSHRR